MASDCAADLAFTEYVLAGFTAGLALVGLEFQITGCVVVIIRVNCALGWFI